MNDDLLWLPPHELPALGDDGVHIWRCRLEAAADGAARWLDDRELARLAAIHHPDQHRRYLASKAFVRRTLARYLGMEPGAIRFVVGSRGKPRLDGPSPSVDEPSPRTPLPPAGEGSKALHFNLTHTGDLALLAVA
ncbi:MAG: hypothetical protein RLZ44_974, partial [Pseudomonadota bacterium]